MPTLSCLVFLTIALLIGSPAWSNPSEAKITNLTTSTEHQLLKDRLEHLEHERLKEGQQWLEDRQQWLEDKIRFLEELAQQKSRCPSAQGSGGKREIRYTGASEISVFTDDHVIEVRSNDVKALKTEVSNISQRVEQLEAQMKAVKNSITQQNREAIASTFVRWGHSKCPASSELVYSGFIGGGGHYNSPGSSTSVLCLVFNPTLVSRSPPANIAELYGAEYQTYTDNHHNRDPVCAVCRGPRPTTIMMPSTNVCPAGWTLEYSGYLMGSSVQYAAGHESVCVDSSLEERRGSSPNSAGLLLYYTFTYCADSLPCPPYESSQLVTCAVCSK